MLVHVPLAVPSPVGLWLTSAGASKSVCLHHPEAQGGAEWAQQPLPVRSRPLKALVHCPSLSDEYSVRQQGTPTARGPRSGHITS